MKYTKIDLKKWKRGNLFKFYIDNMRMVMSLTVDIDVTQLIEYIKKNNLKFYPCMMWVVSKIINIHDEFKYSWDSEGNLIQWEYISPSYVDFHKEDETFIKLVTEYNSDLFEFHTRFISDREKYKNICAIAENQPLNFYDVSCLS